MEEVVCNCAVELETQIQIFFIGVACGVPMIAIRLAMLYSKRATGEVHE